MYREKPSKPLIDAQTGASFVAWPFLHFKDTHKFDITLGEKVSTLSCDRVSDSKFSSDAHFFGDPVSDSHTAAIYAVHSISVRHQSGTELEIDGPERRAAFDHVLPLFGKMLLRFEDCSSVCVDPCFPEDYFKSFDELQPEELRLQLEWAHTYIMLSRIMIKRLNLDSLAKVRAKLRLAREPGEDDYDYEDRIEEVIGSFAQDDYFVWSNWAGYTVDSVTAGVVDLLSPKTRERNMQEFLFADLLDLAVEVPEQESYVSARLRVLQPDLLTTEGHH